MDQDHTTVEYEPDDEPTFESSLEEEENVLGVWVNSGYGKRSYACVIQPDRTMTLPDGLVKELGVSVGDDLELDLNEEEGVVYVKVVRRPWEAPDFMDPDEEQD